MPHMLGGDAISTDAFTYLTHDLLAETDLAVIGLNRRLEVAFANHGLYSLIEASPEDVLGKPGATLLLHTTDNDLTRAVQAVRNQGSWRGPLILKMDGGRAVAAHAHLRRGPLALPHVLFLFP